MYHSWSHKLSFFGHPSSCNLFVLKKACTLQFTISFTAPFCLTYLYFLPASQSIKCFTNAQRMPYSEIAIYTEACSYLATPPKFNLECPDFLCTRSVLVTWKQNRDWPRGACSGPQDCLQRECSFWHTGIILKDEDLGNVSLVQFLFKLKILLIPNIPHKTSPV